MLCMYFFERIHCRRAIALGEQKLLIMESSTALILQTMMTTTLTTKAFAIKCGRPSWTGITEVLKCMRRMEEIQT